MAYSIGALQFIIVSLGLMLLHLGVKVASSPGAVTPLAHFLEAHGVFLFLVPVLWILFANCLGQKENPAQACVRIGGLLITGFLGFLFGLPLLRLFF
ncbi:MAG: hypothetical protein WC530_11285 [Candidatus Omnitrophota bacterium]|jgi:hypothetical protein